jgi:hypothetical protein
MSSDADLLREMIGFTAQHLMELEVEGLTGAAHGERNPDRRACTTYPAIVSSPSCLHASKRCSPSTRTKRSPSCRTRIGLCSPT